MEGFLSICDKRNELLISGQHDSLIVSKAKLRKNFICLQLAKEDDTAVPIARDDTIHLIPVVAAAFGVRK